MSEITSNWEDWFVSEEIEAADPEDLAIWYLGCNGFIVRSPTTTVYFDPYFGNGALLRIVRMIPVPMDPADATMCAAVFVTHEHRDHMHEPSYRPLVEGLGADLYAPSASYTDPDVDPNEPVSEERKNVIEPGETIEVGDLTVHVRGGNDPDAIEEVSYVIEHDSGVYFNSGDRRPAPIWAEIGSEFDINVGSLTIGSQGRVHDPEAGETTVDRWYSHENDVMRTRSNSTDSCPATGTCGRTGTRIRKSSTSTRPPSSSRGTSNRYGSATESTSIDPGSGCFARSIDNV